MKDYLYIVIGIALLYLAGYLMSIWPCTWWSFPTVLLVVIACVSFITKGCIRAFL